MAHEHTIYSGTRQDCACERTAHSGSRRDCVCVMGQHSPSQDGSPSHSGPADTPGPRISYHIQPAKDHFEISMGGSRI